LLLYFAVVPEGASTCLRLEVWSIVEVL
jgi:hypothetical protein